MSEEIEITPLFKQTQEPLIKIFHVPSKYSLVLNKFEANICAMDFIHSAIIAKAEELMVEFLTAKSWQSSSKEAKNKCLKKYVKFNNLFLREYKELPSYLSVCLANNAEPTIFYNLEGQGLIEFNIAKSLDYAKKLLDSIDKAGVQINTYHFFIRQGLNTTKIDPFLNKYKFFRQTLLEQEIKELYTQEVNKFKNILKN